MSSTIEREFIRVVKMNFTSIKTYVEKSFDQLNEEEIHICEGGETNSVAIIMQHICGNLVSRFTNFLSADGEKPDRNRDSEFESQNLSKALLLNKWENSWNILFALLDNLSDEEIKTRTVYVRGEAHTVLEAINRQVWHYAFHAGQIVALAKKIKGDGWKNLSIPKKKSN